jgi:hypothetical protein
MRTSNDALCLLGVPIWSLQTVGSSRLHDPAFRRLTLAQALLGAGLVDEVQLHVCPITLGEGRRLFTGDAARLNLQVLEAKTYDVGDVVTLRYRPERAT